jgi:hypothetical protein
MQLLELHEQDGARLRWVKRTTDVEKNVTYVAGIVLAILALLLFGGNHIITWAFVIAELTAIAIFVFVYSADYELALRDGALVWGNTLHKQDTVPVALIESMAFYPRENGTGAIMLRANGINWMLPADFTDLPGVSKLVLEKLRELRSDLPLTIE